MHRVRMRPTEGECHCAARGGWQEKFGAFTTLLAIILLAGCGTLPQRAERPFSEAIKPSAESALVRIARDSSPAPELTGFRLMPLGVYSLDARVQLARRAQHSLDVQYYLIQNDRTGRLLLRNLRDAALRGVLLAP